MNNKLIILGGCLPDKHILSAVNFLRKKMNVEDYVIVKHCCGDLLYKCATKDSFRKIALSLISKIRSIFESRDRIFTICYRFHNIIRNIEPYKSSLSGIPLYSLFELLIRERHIPIDIGHLHIPSDITKIPQELFVYSFDNNCCGASSSLRFVYPKQAKLIALKYLESLNQKTVIVVCHQCYSLLKNVIQTFNLAGKYSILFYTELL